MRVVGWENVRKIVPRFPAGWLAEHHVLLGTTPLDREEL